MTRSRVLLGLALAVVVAAPAHADPAKCRKTILSQLRKFKKVYLKSQQKCLDAENVGKIAGPCPDSAAIFKIQNANQKVVDKIAATCSSADIAAIGYPNDCAFEPATTGIEALCAALPVTTPAELAECLKCWKGAELSEYLAILYASHANEICGGDLGETSPVCSDLDCTTPLPDQRNLGNTGENDCQRAIGKAGIKYLLSREKILEKCGLLGNNSVGCFADPKVQFLLQRAEEKKAAGIQSKCGNRTPVANPPFCCRTGTGNQCTASPTRTDCVDNLGGTVQEGKICNAGNCDPTPGQQEITWWENCPESDTCPGPALSNLGDLIDCIDTAANAIVDELLCEQFPSGWPCPTGPGSASGAFLD